ncbi:inositol hexakisphosphate and diphosphoinositol-pentakisphosphate kinase isoform X1 [Arctopsyche grandis]|uniref:inositol hexakisphosphate and diphosphoinositol-pentakisphosphate kinase isoform X1 n=1 Tax=Arctopsyche grandis TaxID=121162 RepID=UPI00406D67B0
MEWTWLKDWWRLKKWKKNLAVSEEDDICYCDECFQNSDLEGDGSESGSDNGKKVVVGVCAMAKKSQSKPMKEILTRLDEFEYIKMLVFPEEVILKMPVEEWPICDCLISFHSKGFPLEKAIQYETLRNPYVINNLHMQYDIQDRRKVYSILESEGIEIPRYAVLDRDSPDPTHHELVESEDHVEVNGVVFNKPFVEKPVSAEDHNIYIYYPTSAGGGSQRLFRKIGSRSSIYSPESRVRKTGSFIYEDFMPTDGTDVKVYTVGPDYAHAEARKSPALDGKVERDSEGKEIRYPVILSNQEKLISRKVCLAFKQTVCGFDLLRANGKSFVCDVNGFSFVKNSNKYYDDCAKILGNMILRELAPTLHIPWSVPFQLDDPPIVPTTFGKMMELRCVVAVIRHGDRTPKQKMKVEVRHPKFFEIFEKYDGYKHGHVKLKRPKQLQEILDIARALLAEIHTRHADPEIEEKQGKLEQLKGVLEMYGHFSGINRKVQMKYQPRGRPRGSSSDDADAPGDPSLVLILKWGGELTPAGRIQAEELGRIFRCMYPGGQSRHIGGDGAAQGLGLLRLHSTFRHDLKIYASDEGRVQMTAAAFAKGLLALEGELTPILVQMVKSANTNGLLDNDCDSSKYQNIAKARLHELMQEDRDFTPEERAKINPGNALSINQALDFVKNPVKCCNHVHNLIQSLMNIVHVKKDDPKTKDAILYHGETWELMGRRWGKIEKDFCTKNKSFDISKIPDIYDCIKYDLQHNQHTLQFELAEELYMYAKYLADIVIPQEYGLTVPEKLAIGQGICTPLLKKIRADLQRNIEESGEETVNRLNPRYSHGVSSPGRHVRTRLYFTSESHVHSLLTVLRYGGLLDVLNDEQWRRAMEYVSMVSELNYMSQIVVMLYEDPTKDPFSEERFHVELHFSPGVNCCVQKNLPPGPGFRPHSRNESANSKNNGGEEVKCIEEESELMFDDDQTGSQETLRGDNHDDAKPSPVITPVKSRSHLRASDPIPICNFHHTVSGHEAMELAKRLNEELHNSNQGNPESTSMLRQKSQGSPEPRARSLDQQKPGHENTEIQFNRFTKACPYIRLTSLHNVYDSCESTPEINIDDVLESSTNELPLSAFSFKKSSKKKHSSHNNNNNSSANFNAPCITADSYFLSPFIARHPINQLPLSKSDTNNRNSKFGRLVKAVSDSSIQIYETDSCISNRVNSIRGHNTMSQLIFEHRVVSSIVSPSHCPLTNTAPFIEPGSVRRQRHSIAGQMSYFKMLGFGFGGDYHKSRMAGGGSTSSLFSTAVISGSSSAPNLRDMIPSTASVSSLDGFGGVPPIRPLETLHNALSLKQLDMFLDQVTFTPLFRTPASSPPKHPSTPLPTQSRKPPSPTNSTGWSGPPSLMSSSGGPPSGVSSSGPSSPNCFSDFYSRGSSDMSTSQVSTEGYGSVGISAISHIFPELDQELNAVNVELDTDLYSFGCQTHGLTLSNAKGINLTGVRNNSGDITPVSTSSDWEFNTNEATIGSTTEHDILVTEEEEEEESTLSIETSFPGNEQDFNLNNIAPLSINKNIDDDSSHVIKNDLSGPSTSYFNFKISDSKKFVPVNIEKVASDDLTTKNINTMYLKPQPLKKISNVKAASTPAASPEIKTSNIIKPDDPEICTTKITRVSKSFHGQTQNLNTANVLRRASEGLANIATSSTDDQTQSLIPSNELEGKRQVSRFTTTPVTEVLTQSPQKVLPASYPDNEDAANKND